MSNNKCEGKITIASIAEILNVSPITVSRALSGQPGVGDELRKKIKNMAKELGYKKTKTIDNVSILLLIRNKYIDDNSNFSHMVHGLENYLKKYGAKFNMEFIDKEKQENMELPYNLERRNKFDGVIMIGWFEDKYVNLVKRKINNLVSFNHYSYQVDCNYVYFNYNRTGFKAADYLIGKGHRRIGFLGTEGLFSNPQRFLGFRIALEVHGIELIERYVINKRDEIEAKVKAFINNNDLPTALICDSDNTAMKLIKILHDNKITAPDQVSVIGIGNTAISTMCIPELTTFDLNIEFACESAVRVLLGQLSDNPGPNRATYIDTTLIERQSVKDINKEKGEAVE